MFPPKCFDNAAGPRLGIDQSRKKSAHRKPLDVAGMNPRQQRLGDIGDRLGPKPASYEFSNRLVAAVRSARNNELRSHPEFRGQPEERALKERLEPRWK